ncbi:MAG: hypothetical protein M3Q07_27975, partial [Pseudobdellovibrionaceae bacterium]|nr:hypothetical protein [Pseudobdellovibrionaceae bacterium]
EYKYASADRVEVFQPGAEGPTSLLLGDKIPYDLRPIKSRYPIFELNVAPGVHRYLMRIETEGSTMAPLFFWDKASFATFIIQDSLMLGALFGLQFAMLLYNIFLLVSFKSRLYLQRKAFPICS